jgi:hypothetical protein
MRNIPICLELETCSEFIDIDSPRPKGPIREKRKCGGWVGQRSGTSVYAVYAVYTE